MNAAHWVGQADAADVRGLVDDGGELAVGSDLKERWRVAMKFFERCLDPLIISRGRTKPVDPAAAVRQCRGQPERWHAVPVELHRSAAPGHATIRASHDIVAHARRRVDQQVHRAAALRVRQGRQRPRGVVAVADERGLADVDA